jgi:putative hydrolase of HD superfamily
MEGPLGGVPLWAALRGVTNLARTGWMLRGIPPSEAETVASHSYAAAVIAFELAVDAARKGLRVDPYRASVMALLHDLAESLIGDITRRAGIGEAKREAEARAYETLDVSEEAKRIYKEFEAMNSNEAYIARISELLATYWRALEYMCKGYRVDEIAESSIAEAERLAEKLGVRDAFESMLRRLEDHGCMTLSVSKP